MRLRQYLLGLVPLIAILACLFLVYRLAYGHIAVYIFSKIFNKDVAYSSLKTTNLSRFAFKNFRFVDKDMKMTLYANHAVVEPSLGLKEIRLRFKLSGVHFEPVSEPAGNLDNLSALITAPFAAHWTYSDISGRIRLTGKETTIEDFTATSDDIKLSLKGTANRNNTGNFDIMIYFSDRISKDIPKELSEVVLHDETGGWKSLFVSLAGDYKSPSLHVRSKLFNLNISAIEGK